MNDVSPEFQVDDRGFATAEEAGVYACHLHPLDTLVPIDLTRPNSEGSMSLGPSWPLLRSDWCLVEPLEPPECRVFFVGRWSPECQGLYSPDTSLASFGQVSPGSSVRLGIPWLDCQTGAQAERQLGPNKSRPSGR